MRVGIASAHPTPSPHGLHLHPIDESLPHPMQTRFGAGCSPMTRSLDAFMDESVAGGAFDDGLAVGYEDCWWETQRLRIRFFPAERRLTVTTRSAPRS